MKKTLETDRIILRKWKTSDLQPLIALNADPRVMEFFPAPLLPSETEAMLQIIEVKFQIQGFGFWATELKATGELIGFVGLNIPHFEAHFTPCVEIGWRLAYSHWGKGYATEGARACLEHGFTVLGLSEIVAFTTEKNLRSRRVMEKLRMKHDPKEDFDHPLLAADHPLKRHVLYRLKQI